MSDEDVSLRATLEQLASFLHRNDFGEGAEKTTTTLLSVTDDTWDCYNKLRHVYSLEGDQTQWLVCLLYLTNEKQLTINKRELKSTLNKFSSFQFLKLMQFNKDSLAALFAKMNKAIEMINMPRELCTQIELIERNFNVSCILFAKFNKISSQMFSQEVTASLAPSKCVSDIAWLLFIYVKEKFPHIGSDLVNSFQLLVCCLNLIYANLARDPTLSSCLLAPVSSSSSSKSANIIEFLCKEYEIQAIEVKTIYEHYFKPQVRLMVSQKIFHDYADCERLERGLFASDQLQAIRQRLFDAYETLLVDANQAGPRTCVFELDERLFLDNTPASDPEARVAGPVDVEMMPDEDAAKSSLNRRRVVLPDCLTSLYRLAELAKSRSEDACRERLVKTCPVLGELNFEDDIVAFIDQIIENQLRQQVKQAVLDQLKAGNKIPADQKDHLAIDELIELIKCLYYALLDKLLDSERCLQLSLHGPANCDSLLKLLLKSEPFHKSLFACCFETVAKFCSIFWNPVSEASRLHHVSARINFATDKSFDFPWIMRPLELKVFDFFRIIEMFVKTMTQAAAPFSQQLTDGSTTLQLNRDMVKHLSSCEEKILESLAWHKDSSIWPALARVRLRQASDLLLSAETQADFQRQIAFPFYQDVQLNQPVVATSMSQHSSKLLTSNGPGAAPSPSSELVLNITPNPVSSPASVYSSPIKQPTPVITRVVCGGSSHHHHHHQLTAHPKDSGSKITITSRNFPKPAAVDAASLATKPPKAASRLEDLTSPLSFFFRKFYILAHNRMRAIIDRIDFNSISKFDYTRTNFDYSLASMTPVPTGSNMGCNIITPGQTATTTRSLSAIPLSSSSNIIPPSQTLNAEQLNLLFRKAWNIFEYSVSSDSSGEGSSVRQNLMRDRHLDQMILCAIYITCKVTCMPIQFQEIMRLYRLTWPTAVLNNSHVYRNVLIEAADAANANQEVKGDVILFYNLVYIKKVRSFALRLSGSSSSSLLAGVNPFDSNTPPTIRTPASAASLSPAPKVHISSVHSQFSPRKIVENHLVFVSPSKLGANSNLPMQTALQRKKLTFTMKDANPSRSLEMINEMIRSNEAKIKASNKRLFSEVSSSLSNIANGKQFGLIQDGATSLSFANRGGGGGGEAKTKKFSPMCFSIRSATSTNLLSSIVNSNAKLPMPKSTSSSSLVTSLTPTGFSGGAAAPPVHTITKTATTPGATPATTTTARPVVTSVISGGSSFARKLLNIQTERSVNK